MSASSEALRELYVTGLRNASAKETQAMARWIDDHIGPTTLAFAEPQASGAKADC